MVYHYFFCGCPGLSNRYTFVLANLMSERFAPATELELNRFWPSPFGELVWHLSTQVNTGLLASQITVFGWRRDKRRCFIPCLVYALVYSIITSNIVNLSTLSPRSDFLHAHRISLLKENPLEVTQDGRNRATNKLVASVKQLWFLATPLAVELRVG